MNQLKFLFVFATAVFCTNLSAQSPITGNWVGVVDLGGPKLRVVFHIQSSGDTLVATMDSPDQRAFGLPASSATFDQGLLTINLPSLRLDYEGKLEQDSIIGKLIQGTNVYALNLASTAEEIKGPNRPQEPTEPFPYTVQEISFKNDQDTITLSGTLTTPSNAKSYPVVILLSGSGPQNRNGTVAGHNPFLVIADYLTRKGVAVLRYDERGVGKSTGKFRGATSEDFARDAEAAVKYLKQHVKNATHIGLIGHSEGGQLSPMIASRNKDVSFVILLAAPGIKSQDLLVLQVKEKARLAGKSDEKVQKEGEDFARIMEAVLSSKDAGKAEANLRKLLEKDPTILEDDFVNNPEQRVDEIVNSYNNSWARYQIAFDPSKFVGKLHCPVLALNGTLDYQVPSKENLAGIERALKTAGNKDYKLLALEGHNHLLQHATTGAGHEYNQIEETFSPEALEIMSSWISKRFQ